MFDNFYLLTLINGVGLQARDPKMKSKRKSKKEAKAIARVVRLAVWMKG